MSTALQIRNVPSEFLGMARSLRNRICESDVLIKPQVAKMVAEARAIIHRRGTYRPEHLQGFERDWRCNMPELGRLGLATDSSKGSLAIADIRLFSSTYRRLDWEKGGSEYSLSIMIYAAKFRPGFVEVTSLALGAVSLHALARRYQRSWDNSDRAVFADLSEIAMDATNLLSTPAFTCKAGDGYWAGETILCQHKGVDQNILAVRTFLN